MKDQIKVFERIFSRGANSQNNESLIEPLHGDRFDADFPLEILENDNAYTVKAKLSGIKKDNIIIILDNNYLTMTIKLIQMDEVRDDLRVVKRERYSSEIEREICFPKKIERSEVYASFQNEILRLILTKRRDGIVKIK